MICKNCNFEFDAIYEYCPNCGTKGVDDAPIAQQSQPIQIEPEQATALINPAAERALAALKDGMFLTVCILVSAATLFSVLSFALPVINILLTIFLWMTYASSQKGLANPNHLRCVSGTVYANYIVINVASIILIVAGLLMAAFSRAVGFAEELVNAFNQTGIDGLDEIFELINYQFIWVICLVIAIVFILGGGLALLFNILGMRKIHRFTKSVYEGIALQNTNVEKPRSVKAWLIFFGVCSGISALTSIATGIMTALSTGCMAAAAIISAIMVDKYFIDKNYNM